MNLQRVWWSLGVFFVAVAILVCLVPVHDVPSPLEWNDKASHLIGHGALALYFAGLVPRHSWWKIFVFLLVMGIGVEFAQYYSQWSTTWAFVRVAGRRSRSPHSRWA
jgi:hypothetical protein